MSKEIWIGLIEVIPKTKDNIFEDKDVKGAWVNAIGYSYDKPTFIKVLKQELILYDLELLSVDTISKLVDRISTNEVDQELLKLAEEVKVDGHMKFGTFHTYEYHDA